MNTKYIFSPDIIVIAVFIFSLIIAAFNYDYWGDISILTTLVISLSLIMFCIGKVVSANYYQSKHRPINLNQTFIYNNIIGITVLVIIFMLFVTILQYRDTVNYVGKSGLGILALSAMTREKFYMDDVSIDHSFLVWQGLYLCKALTYSYIYIISFQKIYFKKKVLSINIIPIFIYLVQVLLATGRSELIYLVFSILFIPYALLKKKPTGKKISDFGYFKYILIGAVVFFSFFMFIANLRSGGQNDVRKTIGIYAGSSILAYDAYLNENGIESTANYFGEQTMPLYYSVARTLGISNLSTEATLRVFNLQGEVTNIYTCLYRYTHDYGVLFMFLILFLLGCFYGYLFENARRSSLISKYIVLYALLCYPLTEFSIEERFMTTLITARTIYMFIYISLIFKYLIPKVVIRKK